MINKIELIDENTAKVSFLYNEEYPVEIFIDKSLINLSTKELENKLPSLFEEYIVNYLSKKFNMRIKEISSSLLEEIAENYDFIYKIEIYDSAFDYACEADISFFKYSGNEYEKAFVFDFRLIDDDIDIFLENNKYLIDENSNEYVYVNWGESEISLINENVTNEYLYGIYRSNNYNEEYESYTDFEADQDIYETREDAEANL